jgi:hypothetical protein
MPWKQHFQIFRSSRKASAFALPTMRARFTSLNARFPLAQSRRHSIADPRERLLFSLELRPYQKQPRVRPNLEAPMLGRGVGSWCLGLKEP